MKHSLSFLIIITLLFAGCRQKAQSNFQSESSAQTEKSNPSLEEYAEEAVITGKVLNRDFYPQEKELTLIIPFFRDMENQYRSPIQKDGSFSFRFPVYAKLREVSIRNYAEHLYIHPGDSIHVEIDFKDLFHPKVTGDAEKLNQEILAFTESAYYYIQNYNMKPESDVKDFEAELKKDYNFRLERRNEYLVKYKPMEDVVLFTEELLKQDYYYALLFNGMSYLFKTRKEMDRYHTLLPEINKLYTKGILSARLYDVADEAERYIAYGIAFRDKKNPSIEEIMATMGESEMNQYLYTKLIAGSLCTNDTLAFHEKRTQFDSIVKMSHLRAQVMQNYNQTKSYLKNPQPVSDNLLYGEFHENSKHTTRMPYMRPVYDVLEKNRGKVIYFDFWARWCPPCLAEMEPLKQLRSKFSTDDLIIYSICVSEPKEQWEECLNEYSLKNRGIECVHVTDYLGIDNYQKIRKQWKIDRMPYYVLINRKGQIIDFGTAARPSNPQLVSRIEEAVKDTK